MKIKLLSKKNMFSYLDSILKIDQIQFKGKEKWQKENFIKSLPLKFELSLWAEEAGQLTGFLIASKKEDVCHIHRIAVDPTMTGKGIGSKMIAQLAKICHQKNLLKINAETFKKGMIRNFYLKNSFKIMPLQEQKKYALKKPVDRRAKFLRDSIVIEKRLKEEKLSKIVAIHQPNFLPWLGYFDKMAGSDIFIILDDVIFGSKGKNKVINRNQIKTPNGPSWLRVPIHESFLKNINAVTIDNSQNWQEDHLKTFYFNYKKTKNFEKIYPLLEKIYKKKYSKIIDFNMAIISLFIKVFQIKTKIVFSSELKVKGHKNDLLINLIKKVGGTHYLAGLGGSQRYLDEKLFHQNGLNIIWQEFQSPIYPQLWGEFITNLSAIDFLFSGDLSKVRVKNHKLIFA